MKISRLLPLSLPIFAIIIILLIVAPRGITLEKSAGILVAGCLWTTGFILLKWGGKQNVKILLGVVIGGMLFRIAMTLLSIYFVRAFTELNVMRYVVSLLILYLACEFALVIDYALNPLNQAKSQISNLNSQI